MSKYLERMLETLAKNRQKRHLSHIADEEALRHIEHFARSHLNVEQKCRAELARAKNKIMKLEDEARDLQKENQELRSQLSLLMREAAKNKSAFLAG